MENATVGAIHESPVPDETRAEETAPSNPVGNVNETAGNGVSTGENERAHRDAPLQEERNTVGAIHESPAPDDRAAAEDAAIRAHFDRLWREAETFAQQVPGFDLAGELADDAFAALLSPRRGLTLEQAYFVRHGRELLAAAERAAEQRFTAALAASRRVPAPLGGGTAASPGFRWDAADAKSREALKQRIRRGEKIYPGR